MDETKEVTQGLASEGEDGTTSKEPQTYTTEQATKMVSDALAKAGRGDKSLRAREEAVASREDEEAQRQKDRDADELKDAEGEPERLSILQEKQKIRADRAALAKSKSEHQADIESARESTRVIEIWEIATKYGVDADTLKGLNLSKEQTEAVAKAISEGRPLGEDGKPKKPDSGVTIGGGRDFSTISFDKDAPTARQMISKGVNKK